jgi:hypothetical protein
MNWIRNVITPLEVCICGYKAKDIKLGDGYAKAFCVQCTHCKRRTKILSTRSQAIEQWNILTKARRFDWYEKDGSR